MDERIRVTAYDPEWPLAFAAERERLLGSLGDAALRIDHIGSTAVPGMAAKPVIDIQISLRDLDDEDSYLPAVESLGYEVTGSLKEDHRFALLRDGSGRRAVHLHLCRAGGEWESRHLVLRDYLRTHPVIAREYGSLKETLAEDHRDDRQGYLAAKAPHLDRLNEAAIAWYSSTVTRR
jgi:GrpB-like predicted nucleotidyltransferase (UPF0157 family)